VRTGHEAGLLTTYYLLLTTYYLLLTTYYLLAPVMRQVWLSA
jgi:hypothetical protein